MATITEDYVSFETAKLLVKKGFDFNAEYESYYTLGGVVIYFKDKTQDINIAPRITLQMAMKWLRKVHEIAIVIDCWFGGEHYIDWHGKIMCYGDELKTQQDVDMPYVATYEQACEAAIKYCLENLI